MTDVLFFDVDGTLLTQKDGKQYIPPSALEAMEEARVRDARIYLCTGRSLAEAKTMGDLPVDGIIGAAGAFALDGETMVFHRPLGADLVRGVERYLRAHQGIYYLESNEGLFFDDEFLAYACEKWGIGDNPVWNDIVYRVEEADRDWINKVSFRMPSETSFDEVARELAESFYIVRSSTADPAVTAGEISAKGINKATAIDELLAYLDLGEVRTFGFGDSMNDREMLERCDEAIVMGDARHPEVKELATYVTDGVLEDGVARAMRHFGLA